MGSLLHMLWVCWVITAIALTVLVIYRSLIAMKEEDGLFLDPAEWQLEREQRAILTELGKLTPFIKGLAVVCSALLALMAGLWIFRILSGFEDSSLRP